MGSICCDRCSINPIPYILSQNSDCCGGDLFEVLLGKEGLLVEMVAENRLLVLVIELK